MSSIRVETLDGVPPLPPRPRTAEEALAALLEGNRRYVAGASQRPRRFAARREETEAQQQPFATLLGCSDSRVPPELLFDQGLGDLFVVRVAGHVVGQDVAGSVDYAVDHLHTPLVLVLGHTRCGAVTAALHAERSPETQANLPNEIERLLRELRPALRRVSPLWSPEEQLRVAVEENVRLSVTRLLQIPDVRRAEQAGQVRVAGAIYDLRSGVVQLLP